MTVMRAGPRVLMLKTLVGAVGRRSGGSHKSLGRGFESRPAHQHRRWIEPVSGSPRDINRGASVATYESHDASGIDTLPSGAVYARLDPLTKRRHDLIEIVPPGPDAAREAEKTRTRLLSSRRTTEPADEGDRQPVPRPVTRSARHRALDPARVRRLGRCGVGHGGGGATTLRVYAAWLSEADRRAAAGLSAPTPNRPVAACDSDAEAVQAGIPRPKTACQRRLNLDPLSPWNPRAATGSVFNRRRHRRETARAHRMGTSIGRYTNRCGARES